MGDRRLPEEVEREVRRLEDKRLRLDPGAKAAEEARELEAAGWEQRGSGPRSIWRRPEGGHWWAHYQALIELRRESPDAGKGPATPGGGVA